MKFRIFRYHLSPLSNESTNLTIDNEMKTFSFDEIKSNKNIFFEKILNNLDFYNNQRNILKIEINDENIFVIKLANKKKVSIVENFETKDIPTEPFAYLLVNNDSAIQKIAISDNSNAFTSPTVVKNILLKLLDKNLVKYGLTIKVEELFQKEAVWRMIGAHKNSLKSLEIKYVKPNLANISSSLPEDFKKLTEKVNSQESSINLKAPSNGTLENIDKNNEVIKGLIDYTSEGAGNVKIGIKGYRKKISSKDTPIEIEIEEAVFEGKPEEVIVAIKSIFN